MEDKLVDLSDFIVSLKRIESLLEEQIFRQMLAEKGGDVSAANESFSKAMQNVSQALSEHIQALRPAK
jgi:hypothetical protein